MASNQENFLMSRASLQRKKNSDMVFICLTDGSKAKIYPYILDGTYEKKIHNLHVVKQKFTDFQNEAYPFFCLFFFFYNITIS